MYQYSNKDFYDLMYNCYFHLSRKYPSDAVKFVASLAMIYLWEQGEIRVDGKQFNQTDIRALIVEEMTPEDLDRAICTADFVKWQISFYEFADMVFKAVLYSDIITQVLFERTYCKDCKCFDLKAGERVGVFYANPHHIGRQSRPRKPIISRTSALSELKYNWRLKLRCGVYVGVIFPKKA
ncbi:MAG: hypothetical protein IJW79_11185 [Clostridia bacterium]|nr:hypothetical protein [Clostridia bacterium]